MILQALRSTVRSRSLRNISFILVMLAVLIGKRVWASEIVACIAPSCPDWVYTPPNTANAGANCSGSCACLTNAGGVTIISGNAHAGTYCTVATVFNSADIYPNNNDDWRTVVFESLSTSMMTHAE